jgi:hypothetical protein
MNFTNVSAWFKAWMKAHNVTTKSIGLGLIAFAFAYTESPWLQGQVGTLFIGHPIVISKIGILATDIVILVGIWRNFSSPHTDAGAVAHANAILDKPDAPTAKDVDAATTK